jgi:hypothetical protein
VVQSHVDVIIVNLVVCFFLFVAGILGFLNLWERVFGWIGENLLLDFVQVGKIVEHLHSVKVVVRLEQIRAPSSLRDVRDAKKARQKRRYGSWIGRASQDVRSRAHERACLTLAIRSGTWSLG